MDDLTAEQELHIAEQLAKRRAELLDDIRKELQLSGRELFRDLASEVEDAGEESVASMLMDFDIALVRHQVEELLEVEYAQKRHASSQLNVCEQCGEPIGYARLLANPEASRCVGCQELHEQFYRTEFPPRT